MSDERPEDRRERRPAPYRSGDRTRERPRPQRADGDHGPPDDRDGAGDRHRDAPRRRRRPDAAEAADRAAQHIRTLTNRVVEGVIGVEPGDDGGYLVTVEVLETQRIPNTSDVLAEYEVGVDEDGGLLSYRRRDRYTRGSSRSE